MSHEGVSFISQELIKEGQEVVNNYGNKGNENLLGNYGFVLDDNPEDYFKVVLNTNEQDRLMDLRTKVLADQKQSISLIHLIFRDDNVVSDKLLRAAEIMVASDIELDLMVENAEFTSPKLCLSALKTLLVLVKSKLALVQDPVDYSFEEEEEEEGSEEMKIIASIAKTYRDGQQAILEHYALLLQKTIDQLLESIVCLRMDDPALLDLKCHTAFKSTEVDEFTQTTLALIELGNMATDKGDCIYVRQAQRLQTKTPVESLKRLLKRDFKDFYLSEVSPLKKLYPDIFCKQLYSKDCCFWAFACVSLLFDDDLGGMVHLDLD
jgi:hypothetical protein